MSSQPTLKVRQCTLLFSKYSTIDQEIKKVKPYQLSRHFTLGNIYKYFDKYQHNKTDNTNNL